MSSPGVLSGLLAQLRQHVFLTSFSSVLLYLIALVIYRLFLHPLARFPGPKLAAATVWYEFYYDALKGGRYTFEIERMHHEYGPIVRISPDELHVNEPGFIDELYAGSGKPRDKYAHFTSQFGIPESGFAAISHNLHRMRRGAIQRFFSKASVTKLEPIIHENVEKLCRQLRTYTDTGEVLAINDAFSCMTTDIVTEYAFAKSSNFLDNRSFQPNFHRAIVAGTDMGPFVKQFQWIFPLMRSLPDEMVSRMNPEMGVYLKFQRNAQAQIREIQREDGKRAVDSKTHPTIFHELLNGDLPESEKSLDRLWQEGQIIIGAGTETTAWALSATLFYVLDNAQILEKLQQELTEAVPNPEDQVPCTVFENLPYLSAVISEGLRLSYGVSTRLQRVNPIGPLYFRSTMKSANGSIQELAYDIPAGTPVGMSSVLVHHNEELFPEPHRFRPERWLDADGKRDKTLDKYLLTFSRGSRQCVGINLAYAELYMAFGLLIRRIGSQLSLYETDEDDVKIHYDRFVPTPKDGTKGIRVLVQTSKSAVGRSS